MSRDRILPRTLKGFRDFSPEAALPREWLIDVAKSVYRSYGFSPIDTPALEYAEILVGKGGAESDRQLYRFDDPGGRDVAMRFDLTVPLARFVAQHIGSLGTPFKRYQVGPVWRGENTQRGRYREFVQCDFDTIGPTSALADVETGLVIHGLFKALGFDRFTILANNRKVLTALLERLDLTTQAGPVLRAVDKLPKVGATRVAQELGERAGASKVQAAEILEFAGITGTNRHILGRFGPLVAGSVVGAAGLEELEALLDGFEAGGMPEGRLRIDPSIARGLDYYTGVVFETFLDDLPDIGSCCSGGRYDDLASMFTNQQLPGVGASLGVDRLLAAMQEMEMLDGRAASAPVLVTVFDKSTSLESVRAAADLRRGGVATELYPDARKLSAQLKYADRRGHRLAIVIGPEEVAAGTAQIKNMGTGRSIEVDRGDLPASCLSALRNQS
jgi:histidyl-tRNA synthetase